MLSQALMEKMEAPQHYQNMCHTDLLGAKIETAQQTGKSLFAALSYGAASMAMVFINKAVIMQYSHSMALLTLQQLATALIIHFGRVTKYRRARGLNMDTAKKLLPISLFYNANVAFALASMKGVDIPMYFAIKRHTRLAF